ncbi:MAG: lysine exporter LysO family protein, partial [Bacteroides acidifaciens]|nr:lysine exporter LysO family protein [Bacteroides acidifaciens]
MKGSLIIVSFFIIGTLCGVYHLIPYDFTDSKLSYYALCGLMFCVGIDCYTQIRPHEPRGNIV